MNDMKHLSLPAIRVLELPIWRKFRITTTAALLLGMAACGGGGGGGGGGIGTGDSNDLMESISAKVGATTLVLQPGDLPVPTPVEAAPKAIAGVTSITAEPGDTVTIPISVQSSSVLQRLCAKIGNASSTLCASLSVSVSSLSAPIQGRKRIARAVQAKQLPSEFSEVLNLAVTLPDELNPDGTFCVNLNVQDVEDLVSNNVQVCITAVANIVEPSPSENDQPGANALPAALADGEWISNCVDLPSGGNAESSKLGFRFGLSNSFEEFIEQWNSSNTCSGSPDSVLQHVVRGSYASGTAAFNRQLQKWQLPFDFIPEQSSGIVLGTCFNVLRIAGGKLYLGVPLAAVIPGQSNDPGSCVSAQTRPESISLAFPFDNRTRMVAPPLSPEANAGPTLNIMAPAGQLITLNGTASTDADGTIVGYSWSQTSGNPVVALQGANTAQPTFSAPEAPASLTFELTVIDDDGGTDVDSVTVNFLQRPNMSPVADAGTDETGLVSGATYTLDGRGSSDADGAIVSYQWAQLSGPSVTLQNESTVQPSFIVPTGPAMLVFRLSVTDDRGAGAVDEISLMIAGPVVPINNPPTATIVFGEGTSSQNNVQAGTRLFLDGRASTDSDGQITGYSWQQTSGPSVILENPSTALASFVVPSGSGTLAFELTVIDDDGATDNKSVVLGFQTASSGAALVFTLVWDSESDVDLYVTEPSGTTISYQTPFNCNGGNTNCILSPNGGFLDDDDTDGFGPENVSYSSPAPGMYCVFARNLGPVDSFINIKQNGSSIFSGLLSVNAESAQVCIIQN